MKRHRLPVLLLPLWLAACMPAPVKKAEDGHADIGSLDQVPPPASAPAAPPSVPPRGEQPAVSVEQEALENYRKYLELAPDAAAAAEAQRRIADLEIEAAHAGSGDPAEAIRIYQKLLREHPRAKGSDRLLYQLARAYEANGQTEEQLKTLDEFIGRFPLAPEVPEARFRSADTLFALGRYAEAERHYVQLYNDGEKYPYYEPALYKLGWCQYKQANHAEALSNFLRVLERHPRAYARDQRELRLSGLPANEQELLRDLLRAISLTLAAFGERDRVDAQLALLQGRPYELLLHAQLAAHYLDKERYSDAAQTLQAYAARHPQDPQSPRLMAESIGIYERGSFAGQAIGSKQAFVERFGDSSDPALRAQVGGFRRDVARHYLEEAGREPVPGNTAQAIRAAREFLKLQPQGEEAQRVRLQLAELLYRDRQYTEAAAEYEQADAGAPALPAGSQAAYGLVLCWQQLLEREQGEARAAAQRRLVAAAERLAKRYPAHPQRAAVLTRAAEEQLRLQQLDEAAASARLAIAQQPAPPAEIQYNAWTVIAAAEFRQERFAEAEAAYLRLLQLGAANDPRRPDVLRGLAAAIYQQGEASRRAGQHAAAAEHFQRVGRLAPGSDIQPTADYDAAAELIALQQWPRAIRALEDFRSRYPQHPLQAEVDRKLALAYRESGQKDKAAAELSRIGNRSTDRELQEEAAWQAAELYAQSGRSREAAGAYEQYLARFPGNFERGIEARQQLISLAAGDAARERRWQQALVQAEAAGGSRRSERSRYLAARAALALAETEGEAFRKLPLKAPLETSLRAKRTQMEQALDAYGRAAGYDVAEVTTAATCRIGELYADLSRALLDSPRPAGLNAAEREQYGILLEEQAFPFEEKAIEIHETNIRRAGSGIYDRWVRRSLEQLTQLAPARFGKTEKSDDFAESFR